jgi:myo-inositol-1-phosphate synthase
MEKTPIRVAIVGVGNCASALLQGIEFYRENSRKNPKRESLGLMHLDIGGYKPWDIEVGAAFDIDRRKVGKPLKEAIFAKPNCTKMIYPNFNDSAVMVSMGEVLDGVSEHMKDYPEDRIFLVSNEKPSDVEKVLRDSGVEILLNYLPVGSDRATQFYAEACLNAGVSLINCMPSFIVSDRRWAGRFEEKGIPVVGDDVKSQMGATIIHRVLAKLFEDRGVRLDRTYQINTGGNTDFLNMLNRHRLKNKRISKTEAIQSQLGIPLDPENIHIGPSDYVPWQNDNKVCFLRMEGRGFGEVTLNLELRLSVEDSPNSGGMTIDAIRCCKVARERGVGGPLLSISAYAMKHPLTQFPDNEAKTMVEEFIEGKRKR